MNVLNQLTNFFISSASVAAPLPGPKKNNAIGVSTKQDDAHTGPSLSLAQRTQPPHDPPQTKGTRYPSLDPPATPDILLTRQSSGARPPNLEGRRNSRKSEEEYWLFGDYRRPVNAVPIRPPGQSQGNMAPSKPGARSAFVPTNTLDRGMTRARQNGHHSPSKPKTYGNRQNSKILAALTDYSRFGEDDREFNALDPESRQTSPKRQKVAPNSWKARPTSPPIPVVDLSDEDEAVDQVVRTRPRKSIENGHPTSSRRISAHILTDEDDVMEIPNANAGGRTDQGSRNEIFKPYLVSSSSSQKGRNRESPYFNNSEFKAVENRMNPRKKSRSQPSSQEGRAIETAEEQVQELGTEARQGILRHRPQQHDPIESDELGLSPNGFRMRTKERPESTYSKPSASRHSSHSSGMEDKSNTALTSPNSKRPGPDIGSFRPPRNARNKMHGKVAEPYDVDSSIDELQRSDPPPPTARKPRGESLVTARDTKSRDPKRPTGGPSKHGSRGSSPDELVLHPEKSILRQLQKQQRDRPIEDGPSSTFKMIESPVKRPSKSKKPGAAINGWRLSYFGMDRVSEQDITLLPNPTTKRFEILTHLSARMVLGEDFVAIDPKHVSGMQHDNVCRARLYGPSIEGVKYRRDLEFASPEEFKSFLEALESETKGTLKKHEKSQQYMQKIFDIDTSSSQEVALLEKRVSDRVQTATEWLIPTNQARERHRLYGGGSGFSRPVQDPANETLVPKQSENAGKKPRASNEEPGPEQSEDAGLRTRASQIRASRTIRQPDPPKSPSPQVLKYSATHGLGPRWSHPVLYPPTGKGRASVDFGDLYRLDEGEFLNDNLIEFYLRWSQHNSNVPANKVYMFSTHFYTALTSGKRSRLNYDAVQGWTAKVDIFTYDYVVVPINEDAHWYLAVICNLPNLTRNLSCNEEEPQSPDDTKVPAYVRGLLGKSNMTCTAGTPSNEKTALVAQKSEPHRPVIIILDSLGLSRTRTTRNLKEYLVAEGKAKRNLDVDTKELQGMMAKDIPLQDNYCDCGIYLIGYISKFMEDPDRFIRRLLSKEMSLKADWADMNATLMRDGIRNLLNDIADEQARERKEAKKKKQQTDPRGGNTMPKPAVPAPTTAKDPTKPTKPSTQPLPLPSPSKTPKPDQQPEPTRPSKTPSPTQQRSWTPQQTFTFSPSPGMEVTVNLNVNMAESGVAGSAAAGPAAAGPAATNNSQGIVDTIEDDPMLMDEVPDSQQQQQQQEQQEEEWVDPPPPTPRPQSLQRQTRENTIDLTESEDDLEDDLTL